jgi:segregation and condensation protein B
MSDEPVIPVAAAIPEPEEADDLIEETGALHVGGALHHEDDTEASEQWLRLAEGMVFASASPVTSRALAQLLPDAADADRVLAQLRARYAGRGVELVEVAGGMQFRTAPDLADRLRKIVVVPRRLPRVAMETLAIIAYHQPVTRPEIEEIRGTSLAQQTLDALLEAGLVSPKGRKESPGRPTLWGTTEGFLTQFGLKDLRDLPRREDLLLDMPMVTPMAQTSAAKAAQESEAAPSDSTPDSGPDSGPESGF